MTVVLEKAKLLLWIEAKSKLMVHIKAQTNVLLALTNVLFLKANILEGSLNILFPVVYMNRTKAAWSSITVGPNVCGKTTERGSLSHGISCTLGLFSFSKKNEPRQDCSSTLWLFELCRPSQFAPTATVLNFTRSFYTWVRPQQPIHRPHPAERARCCIDRYRLVLIGTSIIFSNV